MKNSAYRDSTDASPRERKKLAKLRIQEMASLPQSFFATYRKNLNRAVLADLAFVGLCLIPICLVLGVGLYLVIGVDWSLMALFLLLSPWISRRSLGFHIEQFLQETSDIKSDLRRLEQPIPSTLLARASGYFSITLQLTGLALFTVVSFLIIAAYLPGSPLLVFLISFLISATLFPVPEDKNGKPALLYLRWALIGWIIPVVVLALIVEGFFFVSNFIVAVGLGLILLREFYQEEAHYGSSVL